MHINCIHIAMAVMRIAFNIVMRFYRNSASSVKSVEEKMEEKAVSLLGNVGNAYSVAGVFSRIADDPEGDTLP
jgi:hypothetical protein